MWGKHTDCQRTARGPWALFPISRTLRTSLLIASICPTRLFHTCLSLPEPPQFLRSSSAPFSLSGNSSWTLMRAIWIVPLKKKMEGCLVAVTPGSTEQAFPVSSTSPSSPSETPQSWGLRWNRRTWQCRGEGEARQLGEKCAEVVCYSKNIKLEMWKGPCHHPELLRSLYRWWRPCLGNMSTACLSHKRNWSH